MIERLDCLSGAINEGRVLGVLWVEFPRLLAASEAELSVARSAPRACIRTRWTKIPRLLFYWSLAELLQHLTLD